jgi:hypothetical protein
MPARLLAAVLLSAFWLSGAAAEPLRFSGYDFTVKVGRRLGPGPNDWAASQAFVDMRGRLHLRLSERSGRWYAGEVQSLERFGFGTYEVEVTADIGGQNRNVVFGFFNYPPADVGPDATNEIDIEFARWGSAANRPLNYTVWPAEAGLRPAHTSAAFPRGRRRSLHRFIWTRDRVVYHSAVIGRDGTPSRAVGWTFKPGEFRRRIGASPMPVFFNLWGFRGMRPSDGRPVEVIVERFSYTPLE